jgi:hypothetical protein
VVMLVVGGGEGGRPQFVERVRLILKVIRVISVIRVIIRVIWVIRVYSGYE